MIELAGRLKELGAKVRLSVYGSKGHGGLEAVLKAEGLRSWQLKQQLPVPAKGSD